MKTGMMLFLLSLSPLLHGEQQLNYIYKHNTNTLIILVNDNDAKSACRAANDLKKYTPSRVIIQLKNGERFVCGGNQ